MTVSCRDSFSDHRAFRPQGPWAPSRGAFFVLPEGGLPAVAVGEMTFDFSRENVHQRVSRRGARH